MCLEGDVCLGLHFVSYFSRTAHLHIGVVCRESCGGGGGGGAFQYLLYSLKCHG
jgi:hypothetical protein